MVKNCIISILVLIIVNMSNVWVVSDSRVFWANLFLGLIVWVLMSALDSTIENAWTDLVRMVKEID